MNNVYAFRLSKACREAEHGGDFIDHGWALVKALHAAGFIITPVDRGPAGLNPHETLNEMCGLNTSAAGASSSGPEHPDRNQEQ